MFLARAIEISRRALEDEGKTPFGAIVVISGQVVGEGTSSVVELRDPTAHAEVMALRDAGSKLGRHLFEDAVMYASSEPCPMCLMACYWARIPRLIFRASSHDVATYGFETSSSTGRLPNRLSAGHCVKRSPKEHSGTRPSTYYANGPPCCPRRPSPSSEGPASPV
ncbi:nucleoside deaminase [Micromonospora sp. NPDC093277]|uniref:nucleoside deaminase n=1 Tax=Micromonospora sp. NPDC093277 TaxID=3364291 RepID=UPI00382F0899